jgi:hypothetical protein
MGGLTSVAGSSSEGLSLALTILNFDNSGLLLKFSQVNKLFSRYRMVNMNFGSLLTVYFQSSGEKYDKKTGKGINYLEENSRGFRGKFSYYHMPLDPFEYGLIKIIIYLVSFLVKLGLAYKLTKCKATKKISVKWCKIINLAQKIHFLIFNMVAIDLIYYGMRTVVHSDLTLIFKLATYTCITFVVYDLVDIWQLSSLTKMRKVFQSDTIGGENQVAGQISNSSSNNMDSIIKPINRDESFSEDIPKPVNRSKARSRSSKRKNAPKHRMYKKGIFKRLRSNKSKGNKIESDQVKIPTKTVKEKKLNEILMINKLLENQTIQKFCTSDLRKQDSFSKNTVVLISNYSFLLRLIGIHVLLVGLVHMPGL